MIEIKFRAWDVENKIMVYPGDKLKISGDEGYSHINQPFAIDLTDDYDVEFRNKKPSIIMQYIGIEDIKGYEIYEGDILKGHDGFIYRIWRVCGGFATNVHVEKFKKDINMDYPFPLQPLADEQTVSYFENSCEIIGNIYENPELLCQD